MPRPGPPPPGWDWRRELEEGALELGVHLPPEALPLFQAYLAELLRWQARMNLTGFRTPRAILREGFLDSLTCLLALPPGRLRIVDIGSGAGFPGLPLRIARPDLDLTLVEARRHRHSFLAHLCRALGLKDVRCLHGRAEALAGEPGLRGAFDAAFARAVRRLEEAAGLAADFLRPEGIFIAQQPAAAAQKPPAIGGYRVAEAITVPPGDIPRRALLVYSWTAERRFT